jgi:peroxin-11B
MRCWLFGILFSIGSTTSSLVKLRADGRRFALTRAAARKEGSEKTPEEKVRDEEERREKGRALLAYVHLPEPCATRAFSNRGVDAHGSYRQRQTLLSQLITDSCDVWIPSNNLGYTNLNDGIIGALG